MKAKLLVLATGVSLSIGALAADVSYRGEVRALIKDRCGDCHGDEAPTLADFMVDQDNFKKKKLGPRLSSYADLLQLIGWPDSGAFMRRLDDGTNTADRKPGNMYVNLGDTEAERAKNLALLKAWVGPGGWNLNRWEARGSVPGVTREQLDKLQLKY